MTSDGRSVEVSEIGNPEAVITKEWKPTDVQASVMAIPDTVFEGLGGGAAGGGKTDLGIMLPVAREFHNHPKFKALIMRRTLADLEKEIIPRQQEWYAPSGATYNETKKVWKWSNGARIQNGFAEKEDDVRKYDSAEYNYIDWDESTHFSEFQYLYLSLSRCRSSSPDLPAFVRAFTNPGNRGHQFFKKRFVDPFPRGGKIILDKTTKQKRIYIPFLGKDNPHLLLNDPDYLNRLAGLPEAEKRAKLFGDWNAYEGQVFSEFRILHIPGEPEHAVHVIQPFPIPDYWARVLAIDWGWAAWTFAIWAAISPDGRVYIYRTYAVKKTHIKVWSKDVVNLTAEEELNDVIICHSANQARGEELTIQAQIYQAFEEKYDVRLGDRDRIGGKNLVHEYLRWVELPDRVKNGLVYDHNQALSIFRRKGVDAYNEYLALFAPAVKETNLPKLQIFSHDLTGKTNQELIDTIPACIPAEKNPEDVEEFKGDDPYDCLRLTLKAINRYLSDSIENEAKVMRAQRIYDELRKTNDQTAFHRNMEKLEADNEEVTSVRRHRSIGNKRIH